SWSILRNSSPFTPPRSSVYFVVLATRRNSSGTPLGSVVPMLFFSWPWRGLPFLSLPPVVAAMAHSPQKAAAPNVVTHKYFIPCPSFLGNSGIHCDRILFPDENPPPNDCWRIKNC